MDFMKLIGVGALIFDNKGRILLQYRLQTDFYPNCWFLPCGRTEDRENPLDAIVREVKEETSLDVEVIREVYNKINERGIPEIAYECRVLNGTARNMEPKNFRELRYFNLDNLPENIGIMSLEIIRKYRGLCCNN
jgi:ADP-ribose pyrophosphatase YjhB (NUDIX family)